MKSQAIGALLIHGPALALVLITLALVGQPIYANDTWIHLALGEAFASQGPLLAADPHLFAAPGPPSPSSWLGSLAIFEIESRFGFLGLRVFHAIVAAVILLLGWSLVAKVTASTRAASAGLVLFILLSTYRLVQLRPDLFSLAATLSVLLLLVVPREGPSSLGIASATVITALWANVHAAFLLGPLLILGVSASLFALPLLPGVAVDTRDRARARQLGLAGGLMLIASLMNPQGWDAHLAYIVAGDDTLALSAVSDEWGPSNLFGWPKANLPPTWAAWIVCWIGVVATLLGARRLLSELRRGIPKQDRSIDPAILALAVAGMTGAILASRFLWLVLLPLAVGGALLFRRATPRLEAPRPIATVLICLALMGASALHFWAGDWVLVSRSFRSPASDYASPYYPGRFSGHAVWFLMDSGVEGRIYNPYPLGGFMSFWLSPELTMSSSGTMNVAHEAMEANLAIANQMPGADGEGLHALLDRQGIDLFLGTGLPIEAIPGRRSPSTVRHLEGAAGWIPVFRSLRSAIYLRDNDRNRENLERIATYYKKEGVPFDFERGFRPAQAISAAPIWAISRGVASTDVALLTREVGEASRNGRVIPAMHRLSTMFATLGMYERSLAIERRILAIEPHNLLAAYRQVWCLLRIGRYNEALELAEARRQSLGSTDPNRNLVRNWVRTIEAVIDAPPGDRDRVINSVPLYASRNVGFALRGMINPRSRPVRTQ
ncbi:MAG: hypothetical protein QMC74_12045 [Myxococcota bacterium]